MDPPAGRVGGKGAVVLVVDDEPLMLESVVRAVELQGHRAVACTSANEALQRLLRDHFDLLIADICVPGMNGVHLLQSARQQGLSLPSILMMGKPDLETAATAVECGSVHYLIKPIDGELLAQALGCATGSGRLARLEWEASYPCLAPTPTHGSD